MTRASRARAPWRLAAALALVAASACSDTNDSGPAGGPGGGGADRPGDTAADARDAGAEDGPPDEGDTAVGTDGSADATDHDASGGTDGSADATGHDASGGIDGSADATGGDATGDATAGDATGEATGGDVSGGSDGGHDAEADGSLDLAADGASGGGCSELPAFGGPLRFSLPPGYSADAFDFGPYQLSAYSWLCTDGNDYPLYGTFDLDGDARSDLVVFDDCDDDAVGTSRWRLHRNTGTGFASAPTLFSLPPGYSATAFHYGPAQYSAYSWRCTDGNDYPIYGTLDLDGDRRSDLVVFDDCGDEAVGTSRWLLHRNTGTGFASAPTLFSLPPGHSATAFDFGPAQYSHYSWLCTGGNDFPLYGTMDLDGDDRPDLVIFDDCEDETVGTSRWLVHRNTGNGFAAEATAFGLPTGYSATAFDFGPAQYSRYSWLCTDGNDYPLYGTMDLDGDARPDLVVFDDCEDESVGTSVWLVHHNTGSGFAPEPVRFSLATGYSATAFDFGPAQYSPYSWLCTEGNDYPIYGMLDVDGDGRPDLVIFDECEVEAVGTSQWRVYRNTGTGFSSVPESLPLPAGFSDGAFDTGPGQYTAYSWLCSGGNNYPIYGTMDLSGAAPPSLLDLVVFDHCTDEDVGDTVWLAYTASCD